MMKSSSSIFRFISVLCLLSSTILAAGANDTAVTRLDLERLFPALDTERLEKLLESGHVSHSISGNEPLILVPVEDLRGRIAQDLQTIDYTVGVEVVNIIPGAYEQYSTVDLANMLLEMSTLKGLEYYSASKGRMRTLFVESHAIDDAEERNRIDDPVIEKVPAAGEVTVFQQDRTFGKNVNLIVYDIGTSTIHLTTTNATTYSLSFVPIIRSGGLHLHVLVYRTDRFLIYYGAFGARAPRFSFFENRVSDSFYNRLVALGGWFEAKLEE